MWRNSMVAECWRGKKENEREGEKDCSVTRMIYGFAFPRCTAICGAQGLWDGLRPRGIAAFAAGPNSDPSLRRKKGKRKERGRCLTAESSLLQ